MSKQVELDTPPASTVLWEVEVVGTGPGAGVSIVKEALTAWLAHVAACPFLPGSPPFGSCVVTRAEATK